MDVRQLTTFVEVVRQGSFARAAERLDYAQSTVTLHIQQLEADVGAPLFTRRSLRAELTETGRTLHEHATAVLRHLESMRHALDGIASGEAGHVRFGAIEPTASLRLPALLARYCAARPRVRLRLDVGGTLGLARQVVAGDLDFALCSPPPAELGLTFEPLFHEPLALLVPTTHPLAQHPTPSLDQLRAHRLLVTEPGCAYRQLTEQYLTARGVGVTPDIEISSMTALQRAVQVGLGVGLVPAAAATPPSAGTRVCRIDGLDLSLPVGIARQSDGWPDGRALTSLLALLRAERWAEDWTGTGNA